MPNGKIDADWQKQVTELLQLPEQVRYWRSVIWDLMGDSIYQRVQSFTELATALHSVSTTRSGQATRVVGARAKTAFSADRFPALGARG